MRYLLTILFALGVSAYADEGAGVNRQIHVDIDKVVETGEVEPVNGISSAGQPDAAALRVFAESGYTAVIDMRGPNEDRGMDDFAGAVEGEGMSYIAFPITSAEQLSLETAGELDAILGEIDGPVLLHCGSGNRVGAILALRESLNGASDEEALEYGRDAGMTRSEALIKERLDED